MTTENAIPPNTTIPPKDSQEPSFGNMAVAKQITIAKRALDNSTTNDIIGSTLAKFGYGADKLEELRVLYNKSVAVIAAQIQEHGESVEAYGVFNGFFDVAKADYSLLRKVAKVALKKDADDLAKITVDVPKKKTVSGLLGQMQSFYINIYLNRDIMQRMAVYGITDDILLGYKNNFISANNAYALYYRENSEAVNASRVRDEQIDALCDYMSDFFVMAKIAFATQPDLLGQIS